MKIKIPSLFLKKEIYFEPESINWSDDTVCVLCRMSKCICNINTCPCGKKANECNWPSNFCPCPVCLESLSKCKCKINIKKDE